MRRNLVGSLEHLESRRLLAVAAEVAGGDLVVTGDADGAVEIVATGAGTFDVIDDGNTVASVEGVDDDIRVRLDQDGVTDDDVSLQLDGSDVDQVFVDLGDGDNRLALETGETGRSVLYRGGQDADLLEVSADFAIGRSLKAILGDGDNTVDMQGTVQRSMTVLAGDGDDEIALGDASEVGRRLTLLVGDGDNTTTLEGNVAGSLYYRGGVGDDLVDLLATATVEGRALINLGDGDNTLNMDGALQSHLSVKAGDGDDLVLLGESANIEGRLRLRLGEGDNEIVDSSIPETDEPSESASATEQVLDELGLS